MSDDEHYMLKMELVDELRRAFKLMEANRQAAEILTSSLEYINRFCDENNITPPNEGKIISAMNRLQEILSSAGSYHGGESAKKLPEPFLLFR